MPILLHDLAVFSKQNVAKEYNPRNRKHLKPFS